MTVIDSYYYVTEALNKLASNSGQNVSKGSFVRAFNFVQLVWIEDRVKLNELNNVRIDEIQQLLVQNKLNLKKESLFYEAPLPSNYYHMRRVRANTSGCSIGCYPAKEADVNVLLTDKFWQPSLEWGETFYTLSGNTVRIYHNNELTLSTADLIYYRYPININMQDGFDDVNGNPTTNIDPEFQGSSLVEILNLTVQHLAGVTNDGSRYQMFTNKVQSHT